MSIDIISQLEVTAVEYNDLDLTLNQMLIKNEPATFLGHASGRSMEGVGIFDGDLLIIDRSVDYKQNDVVVVFYNGAFICKLLDVKNSQLISASDEHPPIPISKYDKIQLEGVVIKSIRMHRPAPEFS